MSLNPTITVIIRTANRHGVELPADFLADHERLVDIASRASAKPERVDLTAAFAAAFDAGKDVLSDKKVADALRPPVNLEPIARAARHYATQLLHRHAVDVFASFRPAFDRAAVTLADLHAARGAFDLTRPDPALDHARAAVDTINDIRTVWATIRQAGVPGFTGRSVSDLHLIVEPDPDRWWRSGVGDLERHVSAWDLVVAGFTLSLAAPGEFRERVAIVDAERTRVAEELEAERRASSAGPQAAHDSRHAWVG